MGQTAANSEDGECTLSPIALTAVAHRSSRAVSVVCAQCVHPKGVRQAINLRSVCCFGLQVNHLNLTVTQRAGSMRVVSRWRFHCVGCEQQ